MESLKPLCDQSTDVEWNVPSTVVGCKLERFTNVSVLEIEKVVMNSKSTTSDHDPIPTEVLKKCMTELAPVIAVITNQCFSSGYFPKVFKHAQVSPLIKATNLDCEELKNYRPIAHLKFVAKTVERIMVNQLRNYLTVNNLFAKTQSAYREHHSCETALVRVFNDILLTLDKGDEAILLILDYSAAFDTVRHYSHGFKNMEFVN